MKESDQQNILPSEEVEGVKKEIFRKNALNQLSKSEEIQCRLKVVSVNSWVLVGVVLFLLLALLIWGVFGRIYLNVQANGIIIPQNGQAILVPALQQGNVNDVVVKLGQKVAKGQILAIIDNPYFEENLQYFTNVLNDNSKLFDEFKGRYEQKENELSKQLTSQITIFEERIKDHNVKVNHLSDLFKKKQALYQENFISATEFEKARSELLAAKEELSKAKLDLDEAKLKYGNNLSDLQEKMNLVGKKHLDSKHDLDVKILEQKNGAQIISPADGTIMSINIAKGDYLTEKKISFIIVSNSASESLESLVFVSHNNGKKIVPGMKAKVLPDTISAYDYGYILAQIESISSYPASKETVFPYLGNSELVEEYFKGGAPFLVKLKLIEDKKTLSRLAWTSKKGAPHKIEAGTTVTAKIIYKKCSPLQLLVKCAN